MTLPAVPQRTQLTPLASEVKRLIKEHIGAKANMSDADVVLFGHYCEGKKVDPLSRLILPIRMKGRLTFYSTIDYLRSRAGSTGLLASTLIDYEKDGSGKPVSATATIQKVNKITRQIYPTTAIAHWNEYARPSSDGKVGAWEQYPFVMLAKCAEALALRRAFPEQLQGLYVIEELRQDAVEIGPPPVTTEDVRQGVGEMLGTREPEDPPAEEPPAPEPEQAVEALRTDAQCRDIRRLIQTGMRALKDNMMGDPTSDHVDAVVKGFLQAHLYLGMDDKGELHFRNMTKDEAHRLITSLEERGPDFVKQLLAWHKEQGQDEIPY